MLKPVCKRAHSHNTATSCGPQHRVLTCPMAADSPQKLPDIARIQGSRSNPMQLNKGAYKQGGKLTKAAG